MKKLLKLECPSCGAVLEFTDVRDNMFCEYCGAKLIMDNDNEHIYRYVDEAEVKKAETEQLIRLKKIELEEKENEHKKQLFKTKIKLSIILAIVGILMIVGGYLLGDASNNSNSAWYMMSMVGLLPLFSVFYILLDLDDKNK